VFWIEGKPFLKGEMMTKLELRNTIGSHNKIYLMETKGDTLTVYWGRIETYENLGLEHLQQKTYSSGNAEERLWETASEKKAKGYEIIDRPITEGLGISMPKPTPIKSKKKARKTGKSGWRLEGTRHSLASKGIPTGRKVKKKIRLIEPMLVSSNGTHLNNPNWSVERKYDGTRVEVLKEGNDIRLISARSIATKGGIDYSKNYPKLISELKKIKGDFILDSELVYFKKKTNDDFFLTINAKPKTRQPYDLKLKIFDIMYTDGEYIMDKPIEERKKALEKKLPKELDKKLVLIDLVKTLSPSEKKEKHFNDIVKKGGEGIVLKKKKSLYHEGTRGTVWKKHKKVNTADTVVLGYTEGKGARSGTFGAMILGQYKKGKLTYVGKTSGFSDKELHEWKKYFDKQKSIKSPLNFLETRKSKGVKFVTPKKVVEVDFFERTANGILRMPRFERNRTDKKPKQAVMYEK